tara:strand:+ start:208 stop:693 length:486 start_codon:yes stop_codon:yes gene_type:complete
VKKIIFIFFLLFPLFCKSQSIIAPIEMDPREVILAHRAAKNFIGDTTITIIIKPYSPLNEYIRGLTYQIHPKMYVIDLNYDIKSRKERMWTLLHEMGHVIDMNNGVLCQHPPKWMGKKLNPNLPWEVRPWEISADIWAEKMWKALVDSPQPYIIFVDPSQE